jgi:hypothetical protein
LYNQLMFSGDPSPYGESANRSGLRLADDDETTLTAAGTADDDEETEESSTDIDNTDEPRRSLATTATMQTFMSETASVDEEDDNDGAALTREHKPRRTIRLVSRSAKLLLPRSSRVALAVAALGLMLISGTAMILSLTTVDSYFARTTKALDAARELFHVEQAAAHISYVSATFLAAAVVADTSTDSTYFAAMQRAVSELPLAAEALRLAVGTGDASRSGDAARSARWWSHLRGDTKVPGFVSPDLTACAATAASQAEASTRALAATMNSGRTAVSRPPGWESMVAGTATIASLEPLLEALTDIDLAAEAAASGSRAVTKADLSATFRSATARFAAALGLLLSPLPRYSGAVSTAVAATVTTSAAMKLAATNARLLLAGTQAVQQAAAATRWTADARTSLAAHTSSLGAMRSNSSVGGLVTAYTGALNALNAAMGSWSASNPSFPVGVELALWVADSREREDAYRFNDTAIGVAALQGLADLADSPLPWLREQYAAAPSRVQRWFTDDGEMPDTAGDAQQAPGLPGYTACNGRLADVAAEAIAVRNWAQALVNAYDSDEFEYLETQVEAPHRDHLIAILVVGVALIVVVTLYGQWGVSTRLSASSLPYRSFSASWWFLALLAVGSVAWSTGLAFRQVLDTDTSSIPRLQSKQDSTIGLVRQRVATGSTLEDVVARLLMTRSPTSAELLQSLSQPVNSMATLITFRDEVVAPLATVAPTDMELALLRRPILRYTLLGGVVTATWVAPTLLGAGTGGVLASNTTAASATQASCALAIAARALVLSRAIWLDVVLEPATGAATGAFTVTGGTDASARVAARTNDSFAALTAAALGPDSFHEARCLAVSASADAASLAAIAGATGIAVAYASKHANAFAQANNDRSTSGLLVIGPALRGLARPQATLLYGVSAFAAAAKDVVNVTAVVMNTEVTAVERGTMGRTIPFKRRVVWGQIAMCLVAQVMLLVLWRMLFGASWTPF